MSHKRQGETVQTTPPPPPPPPDQDTMISRISISVTSWSKQALNLDAARKEDLHVTANHKSMGEAASPPFPFLRCRSTRLVTTVVAVVMIMVIAVAIVIETRSSSLPKKRKETVHGYEKAADTYNPSIPSARSASPMLCYVILYYVIFSSTCQFQLS